MDLLTAIIDTNVVFEGLTKKGGACGLIIDAWIAELFKAHVSNALSYEYEDVLARKLSDIRWRKVKTVLGALLEKSEFIDIRYVWRPSSPDPGDEHLIDCALNSGAIIVTSNVRDFIDAQKSFGIAVMTPANFLNHMSRSLKV